MKIFTKQNNKGMHTLNATEGITTFALIVIAIFLLFSSGILNVDSADEKMLTVQNDYLSVQELRTFSQSPLVIDGEEINVAKALNEYFSLKLNDDSSLLSYKDLRENAREKQGISNALSELAKKSLAPFMDSDYTLFADIYFNDKPLNGESLYIVDGTSKIRGLEAKELESLQLPAYLNLEYEDAGNYYIKLSLRKELDIAPIM